VGLFNDILGDMIVIAVTGPAGAGKDVAAAYIAKKLDLEHVSGGDILRSMLESLGLESKKSAVGDFGTFLRTHYGTDVIIKYVISKAKNDQAVVNSGLRSLTEAKLIQANGG
jgi:cytidylate kinase